MNQSLQLIVDSIDIELKKKIYAARLPIVNISSEVYIKVSDDTVPTDNIDLNITTYGYYYSENVFETEHSEEIIIYSDWWNQLKHNIFGNLFSLKIISITKKFKITLYRVPKEILSIPEDKLVTQNSIIFETPTKTDFGIDIKKRIANKIKNCVNYNIQISSLRNSDHYLSKIIPDLVNNVAGEFEKFFSNGKEYTLSNSIEVPATWFQQLLLKLFPKKIVKMKTLVSSTKVTINDYIPTEYKKSDLYHLKITEC
jgi:hypothetical protein